ncbi:MAG TPA: hypothetical protein VN873_04125 [Candidatus Angelobacter sp.]|nr:hypothetical protein [Candidatus Angelobacter sp.]
MKLKELFSRTIKVEPPKPPEVTPSAISTGGGNAGGPPSLSLGGIGDGDDGNGGPPKADSAQARFAARQENLVKRRELLITQFEAWEAKRKVMVETFDNAMLNQVHRVTWDELWHIAKFINRMPAAQRSCVVTLGLKFIESKKAKLEPEKPTTELLTHLRQHAVYKEVHNLLMGWKEAAAYSAELKTARHQNVKAFVARYPKTIQHAVETDADLDGLLTSAEEMMDHHEGMVTGHLYKLEAPLFWFYPRPENLTEGWRDFYSFLWHYSFLHDVEKDNLGPYYLVLMKAQMSAK